MRSVPAGYGFILERLAQIEVPVDQGGRDASQEFFMGFSQSFYRARPGLAAAFWRAIGEVRSSREYRQAAATLR
ncbi:hypothetical protein [Pseudoduganella sp. OTU4001]|uniref:hypothetical protein n=1 Tax=Pseudoduganella sp. OTU4001 TaxID=3043854 RepID=UPI00313CCD32